MSYLVAGLGEADRQLLAGMPDGASLAAEIAFLRLRIHKLAGGEDLDDGLLVRMLALLTRMVAAQVKLGEQGPDDLAQLNELVRQRLAKGASPEDEPG